METCTGPAGPGRTGRARPGGPGRPGNFKQERFSISKTCFNISGPGRPGPDSFKHNIRFFQFSVLGHFRAGPGPARPRPAGPGPAGAIVPFPCNSPMVFPRWKFCLAVCRVSKAWPEFSRAQQRRGEHGDPTEPGKPVESALAAASVRRFGPGLGGQGRRSKSKKSKFGLRRGNSGRKASALHTFPYSIWVNYSIHGPHPIQYFYAPDGLGTHICESGASGGSDPPYSRRNPL